MASATIVHRYSEPAYSPPDANDHHTLPLTLDGTRSDASLSAEFKHPALLRDGLLTLADVVASDGRRQASDRTDYLAYLLKQGRRTTQAVWDAQKAFLAAKYSAATQQEAPLDPIISVTPEGLSVEVFSGDESSYARLQLGRGAIYRAAQQTFGTSHFRFSPALLDALHSVRSYRKTSLHCVPAEGASAKTLRVPYRWLRAFGQVQTASTLPSLRFSLAPIDLYNVLLSLRLRKAASAPRALRYELVPGQPPRLVLEPWERVLTATGPVYQGSTPQVIRTWGRQRLALLSRLLAYAKAVDVYLLGPGLPAFYRLELGPNNASLTLALSGWTDSGWAGIATFDLLVPDGGDEVLTRRASKVLRQRPLTLDQLAQELTQPRQAVRQALLGELLRGTLVHDIGSGLFQHRPLTAQALASEQLRYRDDRERQAHRLLANDGHVRLVRIHDLKGEGTEIEGEIDDPQAHRQYRSAFTLDREGRSIKATCNCRDFRSSGLKQGPCAHMIALRLRYARQQAELEQARQTAAGRALIRTETRTLIRRRGEQALSYRLSLNDRQVIVQWGTNPARLRLQRLLFDSADGARDDYFSRLRQLASRGFIDASAADQV